MNIKKLAENTEVPKLKDIDYYVTLSAAKGLRHFTAGFFTPFGRSE